MDLIEHIAHIRDAGGVKTVQTLDSHLRGVGVLAGQIGTRIGISKAARLIGLLHDLGKYSSAFQSYIRSVTGYVMVIGDIE